MVLINGVKYACERCIRGHRVTTCNHTDQPLMMIKPKGRPSTTCAHCKELRKNKNANPAGVCTCGRQEKKRQAQRAKEEARAKAKAREEECHCGNGEKCVCHSRRRSSRRSTTSKSKAPSVLSLPTGESTGLTAAFDPSDSGAKVSKPHVLTSLPSFHSSQSLDQDVSLATSPTMSTSFSNNNWDASSISSSLRSDSRLNLLERSHHSIGLDPLNNIKPITTSTRTRVGEVSVPLEEYVPSDINGVGNVSDLQDQSGWSNQDDTKTGLLDLFADTSNSNTNYSRMKGQHYKHYDPSSASEIPLSPDIPSAGKLTRTPSTFAERSVSAISRASFDGSLPDPARPSLSSLKSSDSLSTYLGGSQDGHHYQDMLHHSHSARNFTPGIHQVKQERPFTILGDDNESIKSVEVLSLTPSFMDIPENGKLYAPTSNPFFHHKGPVVRPRSVSIDRNHRYDQHASFHGSHSRQQSDQNQHQNEQKPNLSQHNSSTSQSQQHQKQHQPPALATTHDKFAQPGSRPQLKLSRTNDSNFSGGSINPSMLSNFDGTFSPTFKTSPLNGESSTLMDLPQTISPQDELTDRLIEPTSSFTSELDQIFGSNNNDAQSILSGPTSVYDVVNNINSDDSPLANTRSIATPSPGQPVGDINFTDLDNLMTDL